MRVLPDFRPISQAHETLENDGGATAERVRWLKDCLPRHNDIAYIRHRRTDGDQTLVDCALVGACRMQFLQEM